MDGGTSTHKWARALLMLALAAASAGRAMAGGNDTALHPVPTARVMPAAYYGMAEAPRDPALLRDTMIGSHNAERQALGLTPLAWDDQLAGEAALYAADMAHSGQFRHSARTTRATPSGENLWMGPRRLYGYRVMVDAFLNERALFRADARLPDISRSGHWEDVGHYSQIIWRGTRRVGCALGEGQDYDYLVCRYFPAGNVYGQGPLDTEPVTLASAGG